MLLSLGPSVTPYCARVFMFYSWILRRLNALLVSGQDLANVLTSSCWKENLLIWKPGEGRYP